MIKVYYTVFDRPLPDKIFHENLSVMPDFIKKDILKYKSWQDRQASLLGKILLKKGIEDMSVSSTLECLKYTEYGRPFLNDFTDFNISHTAGCVICAITKKGKIGLDIETVKPLELSHFKNYFSKSEWNKIINAVDSTDQFFHLWTKKECIIKADGKGMNIPLSDFEVIGDSVLLEKNEWHITFLDIKEKKYKAHLAYNIRQQLEIISINF